MEDWLELSTSDFIPIPQSLNFEAEQVLLPLKILMMYFLYLLVRNAKMDSTPIQNKKMLLSGACHMRHLA